MFKSKGSKGRWYGYEYFSGPVLPRGPRAVWVFLEEEARGPILLAQKSPRSWIAGTPPGLGRTMTLASNGRV